MQYVITQSEFPASVNLISREGYIERTKRERGFPNKNHVGEIFSGNEDQRRRKS